MYAERTPCLPLFSLVSIGWIALLFWPVYGQAKDVPGIPYEVTFSGVEKGTLLSVLEAVALSRQNIDKPPASLSILQRRATKDQALLRKALRSQGYYQAAVASQLHTDQQPVRLEFSIDLGPRYQWAKLQIVGISPDSTFTSPTDQTLGIVAGQPALADGLATAQKALLRAAKAHGFALAKNKRYQATLDREAKTVALLLHIELGPLVSLGTPEFVGLLEVEQSYLQARVPWQLGEKYRPELLQKLRQSLLATHLFVTVRIRLAQALDEAGLLAVKVALKERKHRTIAVGTRFSTDEGPGLSFRWQHRNFFGSGERLSFDNDFSGLGIRLSADFRKPDFRRIGQDLIADALFLDQQTDAFDSFSINTGIGLERHLSPQAKIAVGLAFRALEITQDGETASFALLSLPSKFSVDRSNHPLDPSKGGRLALEAAPFLDTLGSGVVFTKLLLRYSHYLQIIQQPRLILAGRVAAGALFGASLASLPADERFYAGGGGSLRGFGFQLASPLEEDNDPLGGRSLLEMAIEMRLRITPSIGIVTFLDAGRAYQANTPDLAEDLFLGAGVGVRYHTPIGPLRFDLGFPLNGRDDVDDSFQIYLSIGQAF